MWVNKYNNLGIYKYIATNNRLGVVIYKRQ